MLRGLLPLGRTAARHAAGQRLGGVRASWTDAISKHRKVVVFNEKQPIVATDTYIAPSALVLGQVEVGVRSSIWYNAVVRGDLNEVRIGGVSNIGDCAVVQTAPDNAENLMGGSTIIGNYVSIGAGATLRACVIENSVIIGARSVVSDGAVVERNSILEPGSVVVEGQRIPEGELWGGNPARFVRKLSESERADIDVVADKVYQINQDHGEEFYLPYSTAYLELEALRGKRVANA
eukprot:tig00020961_g16744.t1